MASLHGSGGLGADPIVPRSTGQIGAHSEGPTNTLPEASQPPRLLYIQHGGRNDSHRTARPGAGSTRVCDPCSARRPVPRQDSHPRGASSLLSRIPQRGRRRRSQSLVHRDFLGQDLDPPADATSGIQDATRPVRRRHRRDQRGVRWAFWMAHT